MHRQSVLRLARQSGLPLVELPPPYLAPSLHFSLNRSSVQCSNFSSTAPVAVRGRGDLNKTRGVSAIHATGPKYRLGVSKYPLPKPVSPGSIPKRNPTLDHGLWGFFPKDRGALSTPTYDVEFG